jgi:hypothetical protein
MHYDLFFPPPGEATIPTGSSGFMFTPIRYQTTGYREQVNDKHTRKRQPEDRTSILQARTEQDMQKEVQRGKIELAQGRVEGAKGLITRKVPEEKRKKQKGKKKKRQK